MTVRKRNRKKPPPGSVAEYKASHKPPTIKVPKKTTRARGKAASFKVPPEMADAFIAFINREAGTAKRRARPAKKAPHRAKRNPAPRVGHFVAMLGYNDRLAYWNGVAWSHRRHDALIITKDVAYTLQKEAAHANHRRPVMVARADEKEPALLAQARGEMRARLL